MKNLPTSFSAPAEELTELDIFISSIASNAHAQLKTMADQHRSRRSRPLRRTDDVQFMMSDLQEHTEQVRRMMSNSNRSVVIRALIRLAVKDPQMPERVASELSTLALEKVKRRTFSAAA